MFRINQFSLLLYQCILFNILQKLFGVIYYEHPWEMGLICRPDRTEEKVSAIAQDFLLLVINTFPFFRKWFNFCAKQFYCLTRQNRGESISIFGSTALYTTRNWYFRFLRKLFNLGIKHFYCLTRLNRGKVSEFWAVATIAQHYLPLEINTFTFSGFFIFFV